MAHSCYARGCDISVADELLMCRSHWFALPAGIRAAVWREYRAGQKAHTHPTHAYWAAVKEAQEYLAVKELHGTV